ncbi:hypothetical protein CkaCkLH20_08301 [Colletotrichum karsti]|uniref:Uncharacterized protein n=1 Tax=Colletotrichum karsti TaxID=1095194 RepID=A0A9P6LI75_9PEZI|nr:uncharacterized protein CkaCkLH20_08301 [Colletotrichum karsti]KAF9874318.1 hypothetical protein CkaCkLH20_08301 [Colletotrichum karsti]
MAPQNMLTTFLLALAAGASAGRVQHRQADCSRTATLDTLTVTSVEPISIYILPQQMAAAAPTGTNDDSFTAVYTTVFPTFCPECAQGLRPETYTITQTCSGSITQCHGYGDELPPGFTTTQAVCTDCPTPITAVLTVPQVTDVVVTVTLEQVVTEPGLTTTRYVTRTSTCNNGPCLPDITAAALPDDVLTVNGGTIVLPVTVTQTRVDKVTATEKQTETATATVTNTADINEFAPGNFNSGAGHMISSNKPLAFAFSALALIFLVSA